MVCIQILCNSCIRILFGTLYKLYLEHKKKQIVYIYELLLNVQVNRLQTEYWFRTFM